jgi:hypothetical protein
MNSPFSIVSHVVSRDVRSARSRGLWGLGIGIGELGV